MMSSDGCCCSFSTETIIEKEKLQNIQKNLSELRLRNALQEIEIQDLRREEKANPQLLRSSLSGHWKLRSSENVDEFLELSKMLEPEELKFRMADQLISFPSDSTVILGYQVGSKKYEQPLELSKIGIKENIGVNSYFSGNSLKLVAVDGRNNYSKIRVTTENFFIAEDGFLHIINNLDDVLCTRIYQKIEKEGLQEHKMLKKLTEQLEELTVKLKVLESSTNIRQLICGHWRDIEPTPNTLSIYIKGSDLYIQKDQETAYQKVSYFSGCSKILRFHIMPNLTEFRMENGRLVRTVYNKTHLPKTVVFERIGNPLDL